MPVSTMKDELISTDRQCLLRVVEIWKPCEDGRELELVSGAWQNCEPLEAASQGLRLNCNTGLPGEVWRRGVPVVFADLSACEFPRQQMARESGLTAGLGLPVLNGGKIRAVILLLFTGGTGTAGALESWVVDPIRRELGLDGGCFFNIPLFEKTTRQIKWPYGAGLPGGTWRSAMPQLIDGLSQSASFIRGADARDAGLETGLSIPIASSLHAFHGVVLLLSAATRPLARMLTIWQPAGDQLILKRASSPELTAPELNALRSVDNPLTVTAGTGIAGQAWANISPLLEHAVQDEPELLAHIAEQYQFDWTLALPVTVGTQTTAVVTISF